MKGSNWKRQRLREESFANLDQATFKWLLIVRSTDTTVSALIFKTKDMEFAEKINVTDFHVSCYRWKKRYNVSFKTVSGEANACTSEMVTPWGETTLPIILSKYKPNQIYSTDKFVSFYEVQLNKPFHLKNEKWVGGKHSKLRLTGLTEANTMEKKLPMLVIVKTFFHLQGVCFKHVTHLFRWYCSQKNSWMDDILFEKCICEIDQQFTKERWNIVLLVYNCLAHPTIDNLVSIGLIILPPNTASRLQPIEQGVFRSLKVHCRALTVRKLIDTIEKEKPLPEILVFDAMEMFNDAWGKVKAEGETVSLKLEFLRKSKLTPC